VGHDSHGIIRVPSYVKWLKEGKVLAGQAIEVAFENDVIAVVDGWSRRMTHCGRYIRIRGVTTAVDAAAFWPAPSLCRMGC
jgi:LDH2 family malate/lactate/ureidoglycolate dehydrogenase